MRTMSESRVLAGAALTVAVLIAASALSAQSGPETFTARAEVKSATAGASAPVTIQIDRFASDSDRTRILDVVKRNDATATRDAFAALDDVGFVELGSRRTPIKYAYVRPTGDGRTITVVTAKPILFLGGSLPDAKPKEGYDLAFALLVLDAQGAGHGELAPAAKVKANGDGAIVTDDYGSEVVRLTAVAKKAK